MRQQAASLIDDCLQIISSKERSSGKLSYENGVWQNGKPEQWANCVGAGSAAAALWRHGNIADPARRQQLHHMAVDTFDTAFRGHRNSNGCLGTPLTPETMFAGCELGSAYMDLGDSLDEATRTRWREALVTAVDYLAG